MNPWVVSVGSSKGKSRGKITITNVVPLPFDYPMHFSHTLCLLYVESCIELNYDLYILVIVNTHEFLNVIQCIFSHLMPPRLSNAFFSHLMPPHCYKPFYQPMVGRQLLATN
jgi:hypothetical protein